MMPWPFSALSRWLDRRIDAQVREQAQATKLVTDTRLRALEEAVAPLRCGKSGSTRTDLRSGQAHDRPSASAEGHSS